MFASLFKARQKVMPQPDYELNAVYQTLQQSLRDREFLDATIDGDDFSYQSIILELDPQERTILIDEFFPKSLIGLPGQVMNFSLRHKTGRATKFSSEILESHEFDGAPVYVLRMPEFLDQDQRRSAFRFILPIKNAVESFFTAPNKKQYSGRVKDVSVGGLGLAMEPHVSQSLQPGDYLHNAEFEFAGIPIACNLLVKNVNEQGRVGAEFDSLSHSIAHQLQQAIMKLQREQIRYSEMQQDILLHS